MEKQEILEESIDIEKKRKDQYYRVEMLAMEMKAKQQQQMKQKMKKIISTSNTQFSFVIEKQEAKIRLQEWNISKIELGNMSIKIRKWKNRAASLINESQFYYLYFMMDDLEINSITIITFILQFMIVDFNKFLK